MFKWLLAAVAALVFCVGGASAHGELTPQQKAEIARLTALRDSLRPVHGVVALDKAKARLDLGSGYYFLGAADAKRVLTEGWGNPPDAVGDVLGLVFPEGKTFLDDTWGAVVTYQATAYVSDEDAQSADYGKLLEDMRAGEDDENAQRKKAGYEPIRLIGWAQPPTYDAARHDLIWARELQFGEQQDHSLNYDVRHLGRHGVLSLNMVSTMSQISSVRAAAQDLARTAEFDAGSRYADYRKGDKTAGYGLAGLVAAGAGLAVAKKAGLLAVLLVFAKKGFVLIAAGGAAVVAWFRKRLGLKAKTAEPVEAEPAALAEAPPTEETT